MIVNNGVKKRSLQIREIEKTTPMAAMATLTIYLLLLHLGNNINTFGYEQAVCPFASRQSATSPCFIYAGNMLAAMKTIDFAVRNDNYMIERK